MDNSEKLAYISIELRLMDIGVGLELWHGNIGIYEYKVLGLYCWISCWNERLFDIIDTMGYMNLRM